MLHMSVARDGALSDTYSFFLVVPNAYCFHVHDTDASVRCAGSLVLLLC